MIRLFSITLALLFCTTEGFLSAPYGQLGHVQLRSQADNYWGDDESDQEAAPPAPTQPTLFSLDPTSDLATDITGKLGLSENQHDQLVRLSSLVVDWNERINLVSRKDCNPSTVFGRHVLPSIASCQLEENPLEKCKTVVDVGTGGGFPGLPLAICHPTVDFVLLDSVGKKLTAVQDMADQLGLDNVKIHHGRAEELVGKRFDVATGRSVTALDQFCSWMHHLLERDHGRLMYWIGGDIDSSISSQTISDTAITDLLEEVDSDKRILVFSQSNVSQIAKDSGIAVQRTSTSATKKKKKPQRKNKAKGSWDRRRDDPDVKKDRGYEGFKRYSSR